MEADKEPQLTLMALALLHEPGDATFKSLERVVNPRTSEVESSLAVLRTRKLAEPAQLKLTSAGREFLDRLVPSVLLSKERTPTMVYRAYVGSILLSQPADTVSFKSLADGKLVCAALAARFIDKSVSLPFGSAKALVATAVRTIVYDYLARSISGLQLSVPSTQPLGKDPLLADLFAAATGSGDWDSGFRKLTAKALNTSSIPKTDGRWRKLSKAGFDSMARSASHKQHADVALTGIVNVVDRLSSASPTGWVPIFRAFEVYRESQRVSLADFKAAVESAARADKLELAPLNVPSLLNDNERAQSALVMGGLTYHLMRLPK